MLDTASDCGVNQVSRVNQRGWTFEDEDNVPEGTYDKIKAECDALANQWSIINHEIEQASFADDDFMDRVDLDDDEAEQFEASRKLKRDLQEAQLTHIKDRLHELGARMMRPYEHWNEDERYMQYMENRGY